LLSFVDNHDVPRIATILDNPRHLPLVYVLLFTMPGIPCIYYGSEWGVYGDKNDGDRGLRPEFRSPEWTDLTDYISLLSKIRKENTCLTHGDYTELLITNNQFVFQRCFGSERVIISINISADEYRAHFNANAGCGSNSLTGEKVDFGGGMRMDPYSAMIITDLQ